MKKYFARQSALGMKRLRFSPMLLMIQVVANCAKDMDNSHINRPSPGNFSQDQDLIAKATMIRNRKEVARIEGGVPETDRTQAPYFAKVDLLANNDTRFTVGGGTLISKRHVLTASWLVDPNFYTNQKLIIASISVTIGDVTSAVSTSRQEFDVSLTNVIRHPNYVLPTFDTAFDNFVRNQPAILRLGANAETGGNTGVNIASILYNANATYEGEEVTILDVPRPLKEFCGISSF
ncbi:unnamed protein product [Notodromas monacha]|uniref:Peptidase S1 domain-containing protein n=1 Tax=Notodromas monacha TaxID=399045 RepID=A0A7R9BWB6_9CRUS|nr:unnamed protein product [Notodromas monacha]CAG0922590.1 unnamed protein product [Notodromas monacha]